MTLRAIAISAFACLSLCAAAAADPALWRLDRADGAKLYLFGTIHMLDANTWPKDDLNAALADVDAVYVELDLTDPKIFRELQMEMGRRGFSEAGLGRLNDPELVEDLLALGARYGLPAAQAERMEPWFFATNLNALILGRAGFNPSFSADLAVVQAAAASAKPVRSLDDVAIQLDALSSGDARDLHPIFEEMIENLDEIDDQFQAWNDAWMAGDVGPLTMSLQESFEDFPPAMRDAILDDRDTRWVSSLDAVAADGPYLVAVGAAHVVLEGGLLDRFEEKGWTVTRIDD